MSFSYNSHQRAGASSHASAQTTNGPNTFDEALRHLRFSMEELNKISSEPFNGSSTNPFQERPVLPHASHFSPQGYPTETIYHYHNHHVHPNQAIPTIHDQVNYPVPHHASRTSYLPHDHSHHRGYQSRATPNVPSPSNSQSQAHLQSVGEIQLRWMALQTLATTWPLGTIEPRDLSGESPLMAFVERSEGKYHCLVPVGDGGCGKENIKKDRMLAHIRKEHLHFRPLACSGRCGLVGCQMSFPSKSALLDHVHPRKARCVCGKEMYAQNLKEHQMKACPRRFA